MAKLCVTIPGELEIEFTCGNYSRVRDRALKFIGDANLLKAQCRSSKEAQLAFVKDEESAGESVSRQWDSDEDGFFFDNTDYNIYARLTSDGFKNLRILSRFAADERDAAFAPCDKGRGRIGTLNFGNDIGRFDFALHYEDDQGRARSYTFSSEVLSQKIDSRKDWKTLVDDVEARYAMLAADYLRRTYHSFERTRSESGDTPNLVWWNLFEAERVAFFKAVRTILERPRKRLSRTEEWHRADQLRMLSPRLENEFNEFCRVPSHLYRLEFDASSHDTPENRFVKHAVATIGQKYGKLRKMIVGSPFGDRLSAEAKAEMAGVEAQFRKVLANPFFKGVGPFTGLRQMSLTLQSAPGYAAVARTFAILKSSYMLFEGIKRLETKSVADLYEIWCFLKVEDIVKVCCRERFGCLFSDPIASHGELNGKFVKQLGTGTESEVVFKIGDVELARVVYNPKISDHGRRGNGVPNTIVPTGLTHSKGQIPDIVLQLSRRSMNREAPYRLTYLFDAKYRIEDIYDEGDSGVMRPPQDAIDQMHRYRDAIYYAEKGDESSLEPSKFKKEVIGGYVLFPGVCDKGVVKPEGKEDDRPSYFTSIDKVNIGAIPLRPNSTAEYRHLYEFIQRLLIEAPTLEAALEKCNPQKGESLDGAASQEAIAEALLYGTYKNRKWIIDNKKYPLPVETAEKIGIMNLDDARKRRILVLIAPRGYAELSSPFKIHGECSILSKEDLQRLHGYPEPTHDKYYLFPIVPLIEPLENLRNRLKIVTCDKSGVCKGVVDYAVANGFEIEKVVGHEAALSLCDGVVLFDVSWAVAPELRGILDGASKRMRSHQPLAMNILRKKARKEMVRWLRILLSQVKDRKYVLYIDGREDADGYKLDEVACSFLMDMLADV